MKALILTVTAGQGHNITATALGDKLSDLACEHKIVDIYYSANKLLGYAVSRGYLLSIDSLSWWYSKVYNNLEHKRNKSNSLPIKAMSLISDNLLHIINEYSPSVIICTHVFACIALKNLKTKGLIDAKIIGILTDFTLHPYWDESTFVDYFVVANPKLIPCCVKKGFCESQILPYGIPINQKFATKVEKSEAKKRLGLFDKPVILIMSGSMGYGSMSDIVSEIDRIPKCFQIITVCGKNEAEYKLISKKKTKHRVLNFGFVNNVNELMDASDLIITKPGGISVSEALAKGLPLVLTRPIPGHEERNTEFLLKSGAAVKVSEKFTVEKLITRLLSDKEILGEMKAASERLGSPNASEKICSFVMGLDNENKKPEILEG